MLDPAFKKKWVEALRSGEYEQARGTIGYGKCLCCIGVAGAVHGMNQESGYWLTYGVAERVGLIDDEIGTLVDMNDEHAKSFSEIADFIEGNL